MLSSVNVQAFLYYWAHQCFIFSQKVPNCWCGHSWCSCYLSDGFILFLKTIVCFTCMESFFDRMKWVHSNSFQMQMANLESTPDLLPA